LYLNDSEITMYKSFSDQGV